jgi:gamma-glutamyltranspeptidase/glutathione hydrolase
MPVHAGLSESLATARDRLLRDWPASAAAFLPGGAVPAPGTLLARPELADTLERLVAAAVGRTREARIDAARAAFASGFVAEAVDAFCQAGDGLLAGDDLAAWSATFEEPATIDHRGWRIAKARTWTQGPALLQALLVLDHLTDGVPFETGARRHAEIEALKLAFADREAWYGDPAIVDVPLGALLDPAYAAARATLVGETASDDELRAGSPDGRPPRLPMWRVGEARSEEPIGRPVRRAAEHHVMTVPKERDTCHLDVIDRFGTVVAATPSGGWLQTSPVIPGLGFSLSTRGQIFWLQEGLAGSLRPGARPRTTLTPSLARGPDGEWLAFGSPGGDSQEQWCLQFLVRVLEGADLQAAIDAPSWQVDHGPGSFAPRQAPPTRVLFESRTDPAVLDDLSARGHRVVVTAPWELGRTCAALREADGVRLRAAASPRRLQAYAVGR